MKHFETIYQESLKESILSDQAYIELYVASGAWEDEEYDESCEDYGIEVVSNELVRGENIIRLEAPLIQLANWLENVWGHMHEGTGMEAFNDAKEAGFAGFI